jgi:iron-sulfur cluster assembly accessory protein
MSAILNFTEAALAYIQGMLLKNKSLGFRITVKKTGCSGYSYAPTVISELVAGDLHFTTKNALNIYIDPLCVDYVKGLTVDFVEEKKEGSLKQKRLVFINPNEKSRCGCGESFHV